MSKPYYTFTIAVETTTDVDAREEGEARQKGAEALNEMIDDGFRFGVRDVTVAEVSDEVEPPEEEIPPELEVGPNETGPGTGDYMSKPRFQQDDDEDDDEDDDDGQELPDEYGELQSLAKEHGIKANQSAEDLKRELRDVLDE